MKLLLVGDLHVDPFHPYSVDQEFNGEVLPSRVVDALLTITRANTIARKYNARVIYMGDVFHDRYTVDIHTAQRVIEHMQKSPGALWLRGNHDTYDDKGLVSSAKLLYPGHVDRPYVEYLGKNVYGYFLPYSETPYQDLEALLQAPTGPTEKSDIRLVFAHLAPHGAKLSGTEIVNKDCPNKSKLLSKFKGCFTGHIHVPQNVGAWHIVGASMQQNFGETRYKPMFTLVEANGNKVVVQRIPTKAPAFKAYRVQQPAQLKHIEDELKRKDIYLKLTVTQAIHDSHRHEISRLMDASRGGRIELLAEDTQDVTEIDKPITSLSEVVKEYIASNKDIDAKAAKQISSEVLEDLGGKQTAGSQISLKMIGVRNFLSIRKLMFHFDAKTIQLTGPNGSGKSALIEAVHWVLTGETLRGSASARVVRNGQKACRVTLVCAAGGSTYTITRARKGSSTSIQLTKDGKAINLSGPYKTRSKTVLGLLGINPDLLTHTTFLSTKTVPFSQLGEHEQKRMLVDNLLGTDVLTAARLKTKRMLVSMLSRSDKIAATLDEIHLSIRELKEIQKRAESQHKDADSIYQKQLEKYLKARKLAKERQADLAKERKAGSRVEAKFPRLNEKISKAVDAKVALQKLKQNTVDVPGINCPKCGFKKPGFKVTDHHNTCAIGRIERRIERLRSLRDKCETAYAVKQSLIRRIEKEYDEFLSYPKPRKPKRGMVTIAANKIRKKEARRAKLKAKEEYLAKRVAAARFLETAFGDKGIRLRVLQGSMSFINTCLNKSMPVLGDLHGKLCLDENSRLQLELKSPAGAETYRECSDGQQARFDCAMLGAMNKLASAYRVATIKTIFLDERFPYIDGMGQKSLVEGYLKKQKGWQYVIVSRESAISTAMDRVVQVRLTKKGSEYK